MFRYKQLVLHFLEYQKKGALGSFKGKNDFFTYIRNIECQELELASRYFSKMLQNCGLLEGREERSLLQGTVRAFQESVVNYQP